MQVETYNVVAGDPTVRCEVVSRAVVNISPCHGRGGRGAASHKPHGSLGQKKTQTNPPRDGVGATARADTLTHCNSLSRSLSINLTHSLTLTHSRSLLLTLTHPRTHSHSHSLSPQGNRSLCSHPLPLTLTHSPQIPLTLTHTHSLSLTLTHSLTHNLTLSLSHTHSYPLEDLRGRLKICK